MLPIIQAPNPVLSEKAKPVAKVDKSVLKLIKNMQESLNSAQDPVGVGLAAPQVGKSLQIFIAKPTLKSKIFVFINPKIIKKSMELKPETKRKKSNKKLEGCLSLINIWGEVERFTNITVKFINEKGQAQKKDFKGFMSIVIQHEIDHLNGVLFPKRVLEQNGILYKSEKDEKNEDVFEEIKL